MSAASETLSPPSLQTGIVGWVRENLLSTPLNIMLTVLAVLLILLFLPGLVEWGLIKATWSSPTADACRGTGGACWAFIAEKHRLILFGLYPYDEQWRPMLAALVNIALLVASCMRRFWNFRLLFIWTAGLLIVAVLMWGGVLGLSYVENTKWGGLPLTLILATFGVGFAFPLGLVLALGRRSNMPAIRTLCVVYIELIRGVPLISLLFMSSVMLPLFLPEGLSIDKLLRAQIAIVLFAAAYIAEVVRGGLQAIPKGQYEAADALGLSYWKKMGLIILPQALKIVIPPMVSLFIAMFKDTSLVVIIGIFDLMSSAKASLTDNAWKGFSVESYIFVSLIYFTFCYSISKYSQGLEARLATGHKR